MSGNDWRIVRRISKDLKVTENYHWNGGSIPLFVFSYLSLCNFEKVSVGIYSKSYLTAKKVFVLFVVGPAVTQGTGTVGQAKEIPAISRQPSQKNLSAVSRPLNDLHKIIALFALSTRPIEVRND